MSRYTVIICDECKKESSEYEAFDCGNWTSLEINTRIGKLHADFCSDYCKERFKKLKLPDFY